MNGRQHRRIKVSVIVPAHNEEGNIGPLMTEFDKVFGSVKYPVEVIFVNDGSTDKTEQMIIEALRRFPSVRLVKNRVRLGLTRALSRGFEAARGDILIFYPADLQFHPRDIPRLVEAIDNGADMVCGKKKGAYGKKMVSWIYNLMTRLLFPKLKVTDMNSVKAFTREVYDDFPTMREGWHRYLAVFAIAKAYIVREIPVTLYKRHSGKSKFSGASRILKGFTDLIAVKFQVSVFGDPMHLFGKAALFFFLIGLIFGGVAIYDRFFLEPGSFESSTRLSPRTFLYGAIFFEIAALITFIMGIITEALVYLRDSLNEMKDQNMRLAEQIQHRSERSQGRPSRFEAFSESEPEGERPVQPVAETPSRGRRPQQRRQHTRRDRRPQPPPSAEPEIRLRELPVSSEENRDGG